ncbi:MAG: serine/threonine protein phosphatase [Lawsonibacter sp.]|nr:serine/threonine protein phosphatase [Lawsonibacter sp.]
MEKAIVVRPRFPLGRRILVVSDIHGNLPFFRALMDKAALTPEDILIPLGDFLEKGRDSLAMLRHLMELSKTHTLYPVCGNCDELVLNFFESDEMDERFFASYLPRHPESAIRQMAREGGFEQLEDLPRLRAGLRAAFAKEWAWLKALPTILETDHLVFVHGGVPSLEGMEELERWWCMKNDDFLGQGHSFDKWVIVGHWPVTLYDPHIPSAAPIFTRDRKIISIDGGCVLKVDGQLNALILPSEDSEDFSWTAWDGLPTAVAMDPQKANSFPTNIRWGRADLELLTEGEELSLCRHLETGRTMYILTDYLRREGNRLWCEDSTDYRLPVEPGDVLSVVRRIQGGALCKKEGVTGWYFGRLSGGSP